VCIIVCSAAEAVPGDTDSAAGEFEVEAKPRPGLRRTQRREALLSLSARRRLRVVRLGLRHCPTPLLGLLLRRRLSLPLLPAVRARPRGPTGSERWRRQRLGGCGGDRRCSVLFAATHFRHLDALLRRLHEHRVRAPAGHGRRAVWLFLVRQHATCLLIHVNATGHSKSQSLLVSALSAFQRDVNYGIISSVAAMMMLTTTGRCDDE